MTVIEAVTLDLDDTLLEYRRSPGEVLAAAFERAGVDPLFDVAEYYARYDEFLETTAGIGELRAECFAAICDDRGHDPERGRRVAAAFAAERDQTDVRFLPGAREALSALGAEHALAIVTNGAPAMQRAKMDALGIRELVDVVVYAGRDVPGKPDPEPFRRSLDQLDARPEAALHLGNSLSTDVRGARAAGLAAGWVPANPSVEPDPAPDYAFESMAEVATLPWRRG